MLANTRTLLTSLFGAAFVFGCGGSGGGKDGPEAVVKALIAAAKANDAAAVVALFPTKEQLDKAMTCEAGKGPHERIAKNAKAWSGDIDEINKEIDDVVRVDPRDPEVLKSGEDKDGCKASTDITIQRAKVIFKTKKGDEDGEGMTFIKLGDAGWYLFD